MPLAQADPEPADVLKHFPVEKVAVGNARARLIDILTQLIPLIGYPQALTGLRAVDEQTNRKD